MPAVGAGGGGVRKTAPAGCGVRAFLLEAGLDQMRRNEIPRCRKEGR